jgi:hypothetical protein
MKKRKDLRVQAAASRIAMVIRAHVPKSERCHAAAVLLSSEVEAVVSEVADRFKSPRKTVKAFRLACEIAGNTPDNATVVVCSRCHVWTPEPATHCRACGYPVPE